MTTTDPAERLRHDLRGTPGDSAKRNLLEQALAAAYQRGRDEAVDLEPLRLLRDEGYQPRYNGRPSCPFCSNFVDDEETHDPGCWLVRILDAQADR